uniref:Leucine-rich repeat receptor kinase PEPR2 n=2 Tax=Solanum tuberosum TaxID=4113 RepID=M1D8G1_SOLTU
MKSEDGVLGTIGYIAPENGFYDIITQKIDVYSFGVLLFELLTGKKMVEMVDSAISKEPIDCEEDNKSNIEERNAMDTSFENLPPNSVDRYIKENSVIDRVDPTIFEEHGIEIQQQLEDYLDLVKRCTTYNGENRPYMIHVARELRRIEKCFRALTIGQN